MELDSLRKSLHYRLLFCEDRTVYRTVGNGTGRDGPRHGPDTDLALCTEYLLQEERSNFLAATLLTTYATKAFTTLHSTLHRVLLGSLSEFPSP